MIGFSRYVGMLDSKETTTDATKTTKPVVFKKKKKPSFLSKLKPCSYTPRKWDDL